MSTLRFGSRTVRQDRALMMAIVDRTRDSFNAPEVARTRKVGAMVASIRGTRPPTRCLRALA